MNNPPFISDTQLKLYQNIENSVYTPIPKGGKYSDILIDLIHKMISKVFIV
jgi:hypothetical protein